MNEPYVLDTIKQFVVDNALTLTDEIVHQGQRRAIEQISVTGLAPVEKYYYVLVNIPEVRESTRQPTSTTTRRPQGQVEYDVEIDLADAAHIEFLESEAYVTMHHDFRRMTNRLVNLIRAQNSFGADHKLELRRVIGESDRLVRKTELSGNYQETEEAWIAFLYCRLSFTLVERCVDTTV